MSVVVKEVTKKFGSQIAVNKASFSLKKGDVLGFLGPNGAGKTTTMKMITGYLPMDGGEIEVCGQQPSVDPIEVARHIGYLPEHNPLYKEMYVKEYLHFIAGVHQVNKPTQRVSQLIEQTGIDAEQNKKLNQLSKGYRQRVGLAQAILHDPEVLILDEPTSGLDPNQLVGIRKLIQELGKDKSIIFSTHIMQEVQAICSRVIIINQGEIIANDSIEAIQSQMAGEEEIIVKFQKPIKVEELQSKLQNCTVQATRENSFKIRSKKETQANELIFDFAVQQGNRILEMYSNAMGVEQVFQKLTNQKISNKDV